MRHDLTSSVAAGLCAALALSCGPEPSDVREHVAAITDGEEDAGHASVGYLRVGLTGLCTGTLVGKRTVLTAAHCLSPGSTTTFKLGEVVYQTESTTAHPAYDSSTHAYDLAVLRLTAAPPALGSTVARQPPTAGLGLTLVGFGITAEDRTDALIKRMAQNTIQEVLATRFAVAGTGNGVGNACHGDSGGPAFAVLGGQEMLLGVTSTCKAPCGTLTYEARVDQVIDWMSSTAGGDVLLSGSADTERPQVTIVVPSDGAAVLAGPLLLTGTAKDNVGVTEVRVLVDESAAGSAAGSPFSFNLTISAGAHQLRVVARDAAGNEGDAAIQVTASSPGDEPGVGGTVGGCTLAAGQPRASRPEPGLLCVIALALLCRSGRRTRAHWPAGRSSSCTCAVLPAKTATSRSVRGS